MSFTNINQCHSFQFTASGAAAPLSGFVCSEVTVLNNTNANLTITSPGNEVFVVPTLVQFTFKGLTNSNQLSATGSGTFSVRTAMYSNLPQR